MLCLFLLFGLARSTVSAQQFTGTIQALYRIRPAAIHRQPGVSVINIATGETRIVTTDGNGASRYQLKPALYRVVVKKAGFKAATLDEIKLDVQQIRAVDVKLDVGQSTETVSVNASGAATIETVSSTVSQTIENKRVVDLPLNGRNPFSLATLSPGVIPRPARRRSSAAVATPRANGECWHYERQRREQRLDSRPQ